MKKLLFITGKSLHFRTALPIIAILYHKKEKNVAKKMLQKTRKVLQWLIKG